MNREEIESKVKALMIDELEIEEDTINQEASLKEDMGVDSLDYVDIVVLIDKAFGFKIKPEEMTDVKTFGQFCDYIEKKENNLQK